MFKAIFRREYRVNNQRKNKNYASKNMRMDLNKLRINRKRCRINIINKKLITLIDRKAGIILTIWQIYKWNNKAYINWPIY